MNNFKSLLVALICGVILISCGDGESKEKKKQSEQEEMSAKIGLLESEIMKSFDEKKVDELIKIL
jgi:outer membrane murein-binding lipoprotein Lpp